MKKYFFPLFLILFFLIILTFGFSAGLHKANDIISGTFKGNFYFNGTVDFTDTNFQVTASEEVEEFPIGSIIPFAGNLVPSNWLECDGKILNISNYTSLYNIIEVTFGGDNITTFSLPDLRGEFIRGFDDSRGIDTGRVFASLQDSQFETHTHSVSHNAMISYQANDGIWGSEQRMWSTGATVTIGNPNSGNSGSETRPRNIAMKYIIRVK